jgi:protein SCO1/2
MLCAGDVFAGELDRDGADECGSSMNKTFYFLVMIVLCAGGARALAEATSDLYPAPHFKLLDQNNLFVTDADLKGKTWIVDFIFTRCPGACPLMTQKMIGLAKAIKEENVRFVSISVDPENDTPAALKQYSSVQGATDPRFIFLTGSVDVIYGLVQQGFHVTALPARDGKPIAHDEHILLVGSSGSIRDAYRSNDEAEMTRLVADASADARARAGVSAAAKEWMARFPSINASLNAASGILLCLAMMAIQGRRVRVHATLMIAAVTTSTLFLGCYLTYHYLKWQSGSATTKFPESGLKPVYLAILISHTILAVVIVPLIFITLIRAWRRRWDAHRRIAKPTFWLWLYVSATGVIVYWMLYHLAPKMPGVV